MKVWPQTGQTVGLRSDTRVLLAQRREQNFCRRFLGMNSAPQMRQVFGSRSMMACVVAFMVGW